MHSLKSIGLSVLLALATALASATALAAEPHSWCVTGAPMVLNGSTDTTTNAVISNVCGKTAFASCCAAGGRWSLSCVQTGADFARQNNLSGGDFCGRYQWAQGPIAGTNQTYPRDFNLFATNGSVWGLRDTGASIAASGDMTGLGFNFNLERRWPVAVAVQGNVVLNNGTVNGSVVYGSNYRDNGVTFANASRPTAKTTPFPINFTTVTSNLIAMSQALARYDGALAPKINNNITFAGTDPELNVFSVPSNLLNGTTSYTYNVPAGSYVIINISGTSAAITNAGFSGSYRPSRVLWNFPDATALTLSSLGFGGSILAPKATANLNNGSLTGTVVVAAANPGNVELYSAPYQVPSCTGGLCLDPTWSVSGDTAIDDQGNAAMIKAEAGFLEVAEEVYVNEFRFRVNPKHRVWYSFQPAMLDPEKKPLAIMFNGGPGSATTAILFSFNTGRWTLDPQVTGPNQKITGTIPANNWTQLANLLYVDQPATGFSYPLKDDDGTKQDIGTDQDRDAGMFLSVLLGFLKRHPVLQNNRVLIVGESYGGIRATKMLHHLFKYDSLTDPSQLYNDAQLSTDIRGYFSRVFGTTSPSAAQIATKFGHQILIQPVIVGDKLDASLNSIDKFDPSQCLPGCRTYPNRPQSPSCDPYNCDKEALWSDKLELTACKNLTDVATLSTALGVDVRTIDWMKASFRTTAYGRNWGTLVPEDSMSKEFGPLKPEDNYLVKANSYVLEPYSGASGWSTPGQGLISATDFVNHLHNNVATFITVSKFDTVVYTPDTPYGLASLKNEPSFASLVSGITYDKTTATGLGRPGEMGVRYIPATDIRWVPMPFQYVAGHSISMRAPSALLSDVMAWYAQTPH